MLIDSNRNAGANSGTYTRTGPANLGHREGNWQAHWSAMHGEVSMVVFKINVSALLPRNHWSCFLPI